MDESQERSPSRGSGINLRPTPSSSRRENPVQSPPSPSSSGTTIPAAVIDEAEMYKDLPTPPVSTAPSTDGQVAATSPASGGGSGGNLSIPGTVISTAGDSGASLGFDPDFDSDMSRYPASMSSSIRAHVYEGGLRYHAFREGKYAFPNDDVEQNRDDMKHAMTLMLMRGAHFYAPVEEAIERGGRVLDLGTGTGIWCIELADKYPNALFYGVDLSPIQPNWLPENTFFVLDDFEDDWVHPENMFVFIHMRHTVHSVKDRKALLRRIYRHLKPGGYVEFQELHWTPKCDDGSMTAETPYAFRDWMNFMDQGMHALLGSELRSVVSLPGEMAETGFEEINTTTHKCPIGVWPRDKRMRYCGLFMRTAIMDGLRGLSARPLGVGLGWTQLQIEMFLVDVRKASMDSNFHTYFPLHVVTGRRPPATEEAAG